MRRNGNITILVLKQFLLSAVFSSVLFFILIQVYLFFFPQQQVNLTFIITIMIGIFLISIGCALYFGFRSYNEMKIYLRVILQYISSVQRGKFSERIANDKLGVIADELNELGDMIEEQVATIQRLANEKTEMHEQISAAAVMEERQRLARELHDSVSQQLFALSMMASATLRILDTNPNEAKNQLEQIADIAGKAQGEMRALLLHLRPIDLSGERLSDGVLSLLKELKRKTNLNFEASVDDIEGLPKSVEEHLFRIIQEGLSNILRHSYADTIKLILSERDQFVYLYIHDNGKGFNTNESKKISYGLKTMRERCEEIGGIFTLRSQPGQGTYIEVRIPMNRD